MRIFNFLKKKKANETLGDSVINNVQNFENDSSNLTERLVTTDYVEETILDSNSDKVDIKCNNKYDLSRFIEAQKNSYNSAFSEISNGTKYGHWMWFIFPQLRGLGKSSTSKYYGLENYEELVEYLRHPILGKRLLDITEVLLKLENVNLVEVLGRTDYKKLKSCMTLFYEVSSHINNDDSLFGEVLDKYFDSKCDMKTLGMLKDGNYGSYNS